jgi:probable F420-dependent oxidoreductase
VKIEALLPLGKLDPGLRAAAPLDIGTVAADARRAEMLGYDGVVTEETKHDPYIVMALAAHATSRVGLATAVSIAFPRSPAVTALSAWTLQNLSGGRFTLGLGSQVRGHIERRYGMRWSAPGPWMREYVGALRAIWASWQNGGTIDFQGEHYKLSLTVPLFAPAPIAHPRIPVELAAVNPYMCRIAGEVADGIRAHPVASPRYIAETMLPAARRGAAKAGRDMARFTMCVKPLIAVAPDRVRLAERIREVRARVAFYASTTAYLAVFDSEGYAEVARNLHGLARAQRWEEMPGLVSDEMLDTYAVVGTYDEITAPLRRRYGRLATSLEFAVPPADAGEDGVVRGLVESLRKGEA